MKKNDEITEIEKQHGRNDEKEKKDRETDRRRGTETNREREREKERRVKETSHLFDLLVKEAYQIPEMLII